jgi:hypothetical protein
MSTRLADQLREYVDALQKQVTHLKDAADQAREETSAQVRRASSRPRQMSLLIRSRPAERPGRPPAARKASGSR